MSKFKVGDKVKCLKMDPSYNDKLKIGNIYTVKDIEVIGGSNWLWINKNLYAEYCFELVEEKKKHYKWRIQITFIENDSITMLDLTETDHHVSEDKIEDYIEFLAKKHKASIVVNKIYKKLENKFVEE